MLRTATVPIPARVPARRVAARIDPLGLLGLVFLILIWQLMTAVLPPSSLPPPWRVVERIGHDFIRGEELSFYGLADTGLLVMLPPNLCCASSCTLLDPASRAVFDAT
jgi:hypothetical protein